MSQAPRCLVSAGELSGDLLAGELVAALKPLCPEVEFAGVAGQAMEVAGVKPIVPLAELSVMGLVDVAKQLARLRMAERQILSYADRYQPKLAILVDYPGLHFRLAEQLKLRGIKVVQYVAPKLWAWGEGRLARLKRDFHGVLGILPFEAAYFKERGVNYHYVGCPIAQRVARVHEGGRGQLPLAGGQGPLIACLPGSRMAEVKRLLPAMACIASLLRQQLPGAQFIVPLASSIPQELVQALLPENLHAQVHLVQELSLEVMAAADLALVASGTATLECALLGTPMVVVYAMDELSYHLARRKVKIPWVSLVNLMLGRAVVKEYLQTFDYGEIAQEALALLLPGERREHMLTAFQEIKMQLGEQQGAKEAALWLAPLLR